MRITSKQLRQIIREELLRESSGGDESSPDDWWKTTEEEDEQIRQYEEASLMNSPLVRAMHRARIFLDPYEIKDLIDRAGSRNPDKVIALYRSDLERARSPEPLRFSPASAPSAPQYSDRVEKMVAYYTTNPRGIHSWKTGARGEYADMAAGGDAGGIRDEYYAEGPEGPAWSDSDFQDVIDSVDG